MAAHIDTILSLVIITGLITSCLSQYELDERFLEYKKEGMWLVEFYAPWCGHCKKLEPIFKEVANELKKRESPVRVAKIDCTRFPTVASEFSVKGFPTIIFFNGDTFHHHHGDRTKEEILEFVGRAQGPTVRKLSSIGKFNEATRQHKNTVFFLYVGDDDESNDLFVKYSYAAGINAVQSYFYFGKKHILGDKKNTHKKHPTVLVFKDDQFTEFDPPGGVVSASALESWISRERHPTFPRLSGPGLNDVARVASYLVILAVDSEEIKNQSSHNARVFDETKKVAFQFRSRREFQFLWMDEVETVQSIAMSFLSAPILLVMDPGQQLFYISPTVNLTRQQVLVEFLERVVSGNEPAFGGTGFFTRVQHMVFDLVATILSIWQASRVMFLLMFGLPTLVISIVCYSLCCLETVDDVRGEDEDSDMEDEGRYLEESPPPAIDATAHGDKEPPSYAEAIGTDSDEDTNPKPPQDKKDD